MGESIVTKRDQIETNLRKLGGAHAEASVKYVCGKGYFANTKLGVLFFATAAHAVNYIHAQKRVISTPPIITLANVAEYVQYSSYTCGAPNDRALLLYRCAVNAGVIQYGERIRVLCDLDEALLRDDVSTAVRRVVELPADFDTFAAFELGAAARARYLEMTAA
jgi:hypothetical protein